MTSYGEGERTVERTVLDMLKELEHGMPSKVMIDKATLIMAFELHRLNDNLQDLIKAVDDLGNYL